MKRFLPLLVALPLFCGDVFAADLITPVSATSSSNDEVTPDLWPASNLIQGPGEGYEAEAPHNKLASGAAGNWVTADDAGFPSDYMEDVGQPVITFDLGSDFDLAEISVWGYADTNTNGVSEFSLEFATEAEGPEGGSASAGPFMTAGDLTLGTSDATARQAFPFEAVTARYVRMNALDNYFVAPGDGSLVDGSLAGGDRVGLGEVAFSAVPEPSSISLMLFFFVAFAWRRKR